MTRRVPVKAIWALALIGLLADVRLLRWYWPGSVFDGITSSDWTALAWEFAHGSLYRPLSGPLGYGGTRFMPLFFMLHGWLIRAHADPVRAGVFVMQASVVLAAVALWGALRAAGVSNRLAVPLAGTVWATILYQKYATDLRADYLAGAFALIAVACALNSERRRSTWWLAASAVCVVFAAFTKVTSVAFAGPIVLWLWAGGRGSRATAFAVATALLVAIGLIGLQWASAGHWIDNFRATASGGITLGDAWRAFPIFARWLAIEPFVAAPFAIGWWGILSGRADRRSLPAIYLAVVTLVTLVIYASPGTTSNQVIDVHLASVLAAGILIDRRRLPAMVVTGAYGMLAVVLAVESWPMPGMPSVMATLREQGPRSRAVAERVHDEFLRSPAPYLSIDPMIPVLAGEHPVLMDDFALVLQLRRGTAIGHELEARVRGRGFQAIVLRDFETEFPHDMNAGDPGFDESRQRYWTGHRDELSRLVHTTYEIRAVRRPFVILQPAVQPPAAPTAAGVNPS